MSKINLKSVNQILSNKELKDVLGGGWASEKGSIIGIGGGNRPACSTKDACLWRLACSTSTVPSGICGGKVVNGACKCVSVH
jgi:hypothetical protein